MTHSSKLMLSQFRHRYPKGSLISELLAIEHGKYIVKVLVKVDEIILSTGLAASDNLEQAEDTARIRALTPLDLNSDEIQPQKLTENGAINLKSATRKEPQAVSQPESPQQVLDPTTTKEAFLEPDKNKTTPSLHSAEPQPQTTLFDPSLSNEQDQLSALPGVEDLLPTSPTQPPLNSSNGLESVDNNHQLPSPKSNLSSNAKTSKKAKGNKEQSPPVVQSKDSAEPQSATSRGPQPSSSEPTVVETFPMVEPTTELEMPEPIEPLEEAIYIEPQLEAEVTQPETLREQTNSSKSETLDFADIIAKSDAQIKRLKWTKEQGKDYLIKTYGKKSRQLLGDEELLEFLEYLESLPTP